MPKSTPKRKWSHRACRARRSVSEGGDKHPSRREPLSVDDATSTKQVQAGPDGLLDAHRFRLKNEFWLQGRLVRVVDAGEALDLARAGLLVEALGVALLAD